MSVIYLQVVVLLFTSPLHPGGPGPACQIETPTDQRAAGRRPAGRPPTGRRPAGRPPAGRRPAGRRPAGRPGGPQQHGQQLQPEGEGLMRPLAAPSRPISTGTLETTESWSGASPLF